MTAATLAVGLLTTSTYQAIYAQYVTDTTPTSNADLGNPIVKSQAGVFAFRGLNVVSFAFSLMCIAFATFVLWQISSKEKYRRGLFYFAYVSLLLAQLTSVGAAMSGVFVFMSFGAGIVGSICVMVVTISLFLGFGGCIGFGSNVGKPTFDIDDHVHAEVEQLAWDLTAKLTDVAVAR